MMLLRSFTTTKKLLGFKRSGPPTCFLKDGKTVRTQNELAEIQATILSRQGQKYKKNSLPGVCQDPLQFLKAAYEKWLPLGGTPKFVLKNVTENEVKINVEKLQKQQGIWER